ncbi:hypothetical protein HID58_051243 [Brassica napus]|uniref:Uncharacterized protein n=1 Tax=Brassica napus TaxID=3708 RepID=A0ABQ8A8E1_BRANA|nr:hypothetical protein HID58_051243 [Brassica napus]
MMLGFELLGYLETETNIRMNTYNMVKQEFLKKWITTLHMLDSFVGYPTNVRKDMIRLSLDTAIAAARSGATIWRLTRNRTTNKHVVRRILKKARNRSEKTYGVAQEASARKRTLDYIVYLRARVDVMPTIADVYLNSDTGDLPSDRRNK